MPRDWVRVGCDELEFRYVEIAVRPENVGTTIFSIFRELFRRRTDAVVVGVVVVVVVVVVAGRRKFNRFTNLNFLKKIVGHWLGMLSGGRLAIAFPVPVVLTVCATTGSLPPHHNLILVTSTVHNPRAHAGRH
jgi:hypothetical protein